MKERIAITYAYDGKFWDHQRIVFQVVTEGPDAESSKCYTAELNANGGPPKQDDPEVWKRDWKRLLREHPFTVYTEMHEVKCEGAPAEVGGSPRRTTCRNWGRSWRGLSPSSVGMSARHSTPPTRSGFGRGRIRHTAYRPTTARPGRRPSRRSSRNGAAGHSGRRNGSGGSPAAKSRILPFVLKT